MTLKWSHLKYLSIYWRVEGGCKQIILIKFYVENFSTTLMNNYFKSDFVLIAPINKSLSNYLCIKLFIKKHLSDFIFNNIKNK